MTDVAVSTRPPIKTRMKIYPLLCLTFCAVIPTSPEQIPRPRWMSKAAMASASISISPYLRQVMLWLHAGMIARSARPLLLGSSPSSPPSPCCCSCPNIFAGRYGSIVATCSKWPSHRPLMLWPSSSARLQPQSLKSRKIGAGEPDPDQPRFQQWT